jgi:hypothetical protein
VRLVLKIVMQNDKDFVNLILLYTARPLPARSQAKESDDPPFKGGPIHNA